MVKISYISKVSGSQVIIFIIFLTSKYIKWFIEFRAGMVIKLNLADNWLPILGKIWYSKYIMGENMTPSIC